MLSSFAFIFSCTDVDEVLVGDITTDVAVEGLSTGGSSGGSADAVASAYSQLRSTGTAGHTNWYSAQELTSDEMVVTTKKNIKKKSIAINEVSILRQSRQASSVEIFSGKKTIIKIIHEI